MDITTRRGKVLWVDSDHSHHVQVHGGEKIVATVASFWGEFPHQLLRVGDPVEILYNSSGSWLAVRPSKVRSKVGRDPHADPKAQYLKCAYLPQRPEQIPQGLADVFYFTPMGYGDAGWARTAMKTRYLLVSEEEVEVVQYHTRGETKFQCRRALALVTGDKDDGSWSTGTVDRVLPGLLGFTMDVYPSELVNREGEPLFEKGKRIR